MSSNMQYLADMQNLEDGMVKLVAYSIVSLRRRAERILEGGEGSIIITSRMTPETFAAFIVARYLQTKDGKGNPRQIPEEDRKYLRVHYVVSNRWPRQPRKFEEEQIEVLEEISQVVGGKNESRGAPT